MFRTIIEAIMPIKHIENPIYQIAKANHAGRSCRNPALYLPRPLSQYTALLSLYAWWKGTPSWNTIVMM